MFHLKCIPILAVFLFYPATGAQAQTTASYVDKATAFSEAKAQGKMILMVAGRVSCGNCAYMRSSVFPVSNPDVKGTLASRYVIWNPDVDFTGDHWPYSPSGGGTLPFMAVIDTSTPAVALDKTTGIQEVEPFHARISQYFPGTPTLEKLGPWPLAAGSSAEVLVATGQHIDFQLAGTLAPTRYEAASLPEWLTLDGATGRLRGTAPLTGVEVTISLKAFNANGSSSAKSVRLRVLGDLFSTAGHAAWTEQSLVARSQNAWQSGNIADNERSDLNVVVNGPFNVTYQLKISTEESYDFFRIFLDGALISSASGNQDWTPKSIAVPEGTHVLTFRYEKDWGYDDGADTVWIDDLTLPAAVLLSPALTISSFGWVSPGTLRLQFSSESGAAYEIESSASLSSTGWEAVPGTRTIGNGQALSVDVPADPGAHPSWFLRLRKL